MAAISIFPGKYLRILLLPALFVFSLALLAACTAKQAPPAPTPVVLPPGVDAGMKVTVEMSKPAKGTFYVAGDKATVTITLKDNFGNPLTKDDFATLNLYMYGPQETAKTVTAVKLLNATTDRTKTPHHYIDLLKDANVQVAGNVLKYNLQPVSNEEPGTYTASLRVIKKGDPPVNQAFVLVDFQLGTATVEKQIVEKEKCAQCHQGAQNGQFYFAHVDVGRSPYGNPAIDSIPVRTCKSCHNNDGYSAYVSPADGKTRIVDQIVKRVHGVHMGEHLENPTNTDPKTGVFREYTGVVFPANIKDCNYCHVDDRWKTQPSRLACGACHDSIDFATGKSVVKGGKDHGGGPQASDGACASCHTPDTGGVKPISVAHKVTPSASLSGATLNKIDISLTPPRNGKFYVAGERPVATVVIRDDTGKPIDHTKVDEATFSTASFFVYGPRYQSVPVLTNAAKNGDSKARASATSSIPAAGEPSKGWTFAEGDTFKLAVNGGPVQVLNATPGLQTPDQVRDWLRANLKDVTVTSNNTAGSVTILSNVIGAPTSRFEIYNSPVTTKMGWKPGPLDLIREGVKYGKTPGTTMEPYVVMGNVSIPAVDLRPRSDPLIYTDPLVVRSADKITYQMDDVGTLKRGTYMAYAYHIPNGVLAGTLAKPGPGGKPNAAAAQNLSRSGIGHMTFQVGTETPDKKVATNCGSCHSDTIWHLDEGPIHAEPFDTDYCKACHDYARFSGTGDLFPRVGGNSTSGWAGYGAKPIVARVHTIHFGRYLEHPEWGYAGNPNAFSEIIFPQDVRNCQKCHDPKTTSDHWKTNPNRLACQSCHDSAKATAHMDLQIQNPTPSDPYNPKRVETCTLCHGAGRDFAVEKVHDISKPYKPPYPRAPEH